MPATLCTTLDSVNPVNHFSTEMSFSVLRRLKTYVRLTMKNDRLSSLGLMHIHWDFEVNLLKHKGQILDNFKKFLSIKVIKIVLDSMLYETLKWPQIAPFCISSNKNSPLKNYGVHTIKPQLLPLHACFCWYEKSLHKNKNNSLKLSGIIICCLQFKFHLIHDLLFFLKEIEL